MADNKISTFNAADMISLLMKNKHSTASELPADERRVRKNYEIERTSSTSLLSPVEVRKKRKVIMCRLITLFALMISLSLSCLSMHVRSGINWHESRIFVFMLLCCVFISNNNN